MENEEGAFVRGTCRYCGQVRIVPVSVTQDEADERAADECDCSGAVRERHRLERVERAAENIDRVFGSGDSDYGQRPVGGDVLDFLRHAEINAALFDEDRAEHAAVDEMSRRVVELGPYAGLATYNIAEDYYHSEMNYQTIRQAIQTLNPSK